MIIMNHIFSQQNNLYHDSNPLFLGAIIKSKLENNSSSGYDNSYTNRKPLSYRKTPLKQPWATISSPNPNPIFD